MEVYASFGLYKAVDILDSVLLYEHKKIIVTMKKLKLLNPFYKIYSQR